MAASHRLGPRRGRSRTRDRPTPRRTDAARSHDATPGSGSGSDVRTARGRGASPAPGKRHRARPSRRAPSPSPAQPAQAPPSLASSAGSDASGAVAAPPSASAPVSAPQLPPQHPPQGASGGGMASAGGGPFSREAEASSAAPKPRQRATHLTGSTDGGDAVGSQPRDAAAPPNVFPRWDPTARPVSGAKTFQVNPSRDDGDGGSVGGGRQVDSDSHGGGAGCDNARRNTPSLATRRAPKPTRRSSIASSGVLALDAPAQPPSSPRDFWARKGVTQRFVGCWHARVAQGWHSWLTAAVSVVFLSGSRCPRPCM